MRTRMDLQSDTHRDEVVTRESRCFAALGVLFPLLLFRVSRRSVADLSASNLASPSRPGGGPPAHRHTTLDEFRSARHSLSARQSASVGLDTERSEQRDC